MKGMFKPGISQTTILILRRKCWISNVDVSHDCRHIKKGVNVIFELQVFNECSSTKITKKKKRKCGGITLLNAPQVLPDISFGAATFPLLFVAA
jgi:hypothetical protein